MHRGLLAGVTMVCAAASFVAACGDLVDTSVPGTRLVDAGSQSGDAGSTTADGGPVTSSEASSPDGGSATACAVLDDFSSDPVLYEPAKAGWTRRTPTGTYEVRSDADGQGDSWGVALTADSSLHAGASLERTIGSGCDLRVVARLMVSAAPRFTLVKLNANGRTVTVDYANNQLFPSVIGETPRPGVAFAGGSFHDLAIAVSPSGEVILDVDTNETVLAPEAGPVLIVGSLAIGYVSDATPATGKIDVLLDSFQIH